MQLIKQLHASLNKKAKINAKKNKKLEEEKDQDNKSIEDKNKKRKKPEKDNIIQSINQISLKEINKPKNEIESNTNIYIKPKDRNPLEYQKINSFFIEETLDKNYEIQKVYEIQEIKEGKKIFR